MIAPCRLLAQAGIDIRTLSLADTQRFGILRMIVPDWEKAKALLEERGAVVKVTEVLAVEVPDRPGGLAEVLELFEGTGINIEYMYAFPVRAGKEGGADLPLRPAGRGDRAAAVRRDQRPGWRGAGEPVMGISKAIAAQLQNASWIRRMFEEGTRLKRERGAENVYDFTLGNPDVEPPEAVLRALERVVREKRPGMHGYMPNPGFHDVREAVAGMLRRDTGLEFVPEDVFMTVGSAGACNVILKSILDPGDEVIVLMPCFSEYPFYVSNHAGCMVPVETGDDFLPDVERIEAAITARTRALILNTPNNPTGRVYPESVLRGFRRCWSGRTIR